MPHCPPPKSESKAALLREEAERRAEQKDVRIERALKLHASGESHIVIQRRLGITKPTLRKWLRGAGLSGNSAKPTQSEEAAKDLRPLNLSFSGQGGSNAIRDYQQFQAEKWGG